jgi:hypothetical protein
VHATDFQNTANWGNVDQQAMGYCEGLIARIRTLIACLEALAHRSQQF